jgi:RNA polymerase sigma factor (sigma-70 family)
MGMHGKNDRGAKRSDGREEPPPEGDHSAGEEHFIGDLALLADPDADPVARRREWDRTYAHYTAKMHRYFAREVPQQTDREDLIHEIWSRILPHLGTLEDGAVMWAWLTRTGRRRLIDQGRAAGTARRNAKARPDELNSALLSAPATDALTALTEDAVPTELSAIAQHLVGLNDEERRLLDLKAAGRSHEEMAALLGLKNAAASRKRWERVLKKIRVSLGIA